MVFSEKIKNLAKQKAHYTCVWCQRMDIFLDVHHMIPQEEGGPDDLDNAAPLCPNCHTMAGANPNLRKELRHRRNFWWDECSKTQAPVIIASLGPLQEQIDHLRARQDAQDENYRREFAEVKAVVQQVVDTRADEISSANTVTELIQGSTGTTLDPVRNLALFSALSHRRRR